MKEAGRDAENTSSVVVEDGRRMAEERDEERFSVSVDVGDAMAEEEAAERGAEDGAASCRLEAPKEDEEPGGDVVESSRRALDADRLVASASCGSHVMEA